MAKHRQYKCRYSEINTVKPILFSGNLSFKSIKQGREMFANSTDKYTLHSITYVGWK